VRREGSGLAVGDRLIERAGGRALVIHAWTVPDGWDEPHHLDVAVAAIDREGDVTTRGERLRLWPFRHEALHEDLRAAGLTLASTTYSEDVERYLVTARKEPGDGPGPRP
jgi:hypothetical protein